MKYIVFALPLIFLMACKKENTPDAGNADKLPVKITEIFDDEPEVSTFEYDDQKRLTRYVCAEEENYGSVISLFYLNDELSYTTTYWNDLKQTTRLDYSRSGNVVTCTGRENEKGDIRDVTYIITLHAQGYPESIDGPYESDLSTYLYDARGNPVERSGSGTLSVGEYDGKKGIFSACTTPAWWFYQEGVFRQYLRNNLLKETYTKGNITSEYSYTYTYDADGYPVRMTVDDEEETVIEYKSL
ncbi:MAG: hypothetical protein LBR08_02585 [Bacteroidales bacterium]|nr:hypothetical protein [Bacteroidales bacterium]